MQCESDDHAFFVVAAVVVFVVVAKLIDQQKERVKSSHAHHPVDPIHVLLQPQQLYKKFLVRDFDYNTSSNLWAAAVSTLMCAFFFPVEELCGKIHATASRLARSVCLVPQ